jgi:long-chain acyl-CoA synthetase
MGSGQSK